LNYIYGWAWHEQGRFPVEGLDEAQAKKKWAKGPQVSVSAGEDLVEGKVPAYTLSMSARAEAVDVYLYDAEGSVVSVLGWRSVDERLFLTDVIEYLYPEDGDFHEQDECLANRQYLFKPDGYAGLRHGRRRRHRGGVHRRRRLEPLARPARVGRLGPHRRLPAQRRLPGLTPRRTLVACRTTSPSSI